MATPITVQVRGRMLVTDLQGKLREGVIELLEGWSDRSYDSSQGYVPVETGDLKASGAKQAPSELTRRVIYEAYNASGHNYGVYQEYGTRFHGAQAFLGPGFWDGTDWVFANARGVIESKFGG